MLNKREAFSFYKSIYEKSPELMIQCDCYPEGSTEPK